ncbi:MAG: DEAD/DEAH box helicase family protein, partial [Actinomycetia bacterium]|nr:DEAD/DEAH box helicase family protein [Actinomycetes bacterium]
MSSRSSGGPGSASSSPISAATSKPANHYASSPPPTPAAPNCGPWRPWPNSAPNSGVSYDTSTTRLHARAWLSHRASGFSTVDIGSSNLTFSAQVTGLEWNVRASQRLNPELVSAFDRTFATYWADSHFEPFESERFARATAAVESDTSILTPFEIEPYPFQRQILERLQVERRKGHAHNLIAAATGTGKTIIAALDYRHLRTELDRARLLFVAHRSEILQQSQPIHRRLQHPPPALHLRDAPTRGLRTAPSPQGHLEASVAMPRGAGFGANLDRAARVLGCPGRAHAPHRRRGVSPCRSTGPAGVPSRRRVRCALGDDHECRG